MPATYDKRSILDRFDIYVVDWDPDSADKVIVDLTTGSTPDTLLPIRDMSGLAVALILNTGGGTPGGIEEFEIIAATDNVGAGAVVVKASDLGGGATPTTVGDVLFLEVDVEQIYEVLSTATHVGVRAEAVAATDEGTVVVIVDTKKKYGGLTDDLVQ